MERIEGSFASFLRFGRRSAYYLVCISLGTATGERHFRAVTRGNKCFGGEIGSGTEKLDTLAESVPYVTNPVSDVNAVHLLQTAHHYVNEEVHKYSLLVSSDNQ